MKGLLAKVRTGERGVVIIWIAFFMVFMLGFVALGIDVAKVMATRTQLQNAADAAALAGASAVNTTTGNIMPDTALFRAQAAAVSNKAFVNEPLPVQLLAGDVSYPTPKQVKVVVRREAGAGGEMITHVAQVLGLRTLSVNATATAEASLSSSVCEALVPMGAIPVANDPNYFQAGCGSNYILELGAGSGIRGNYQSLSFPDCQEGPCMGMPATGASTYRCLLEGGYGCCVSLGQVIQTEPGVMSGPTRTGLQARWDSDTDRRSGICHNQYTGNGNRVINVPLITAPTMGRTDVRVIGFASFFLIRRPAGGPGQPIEGEFIHQILPGEGGGPSGTILTIRLVK